MRLFVSVLLLAASVAVAQTAPQVKILPNGKVAGQSACPLTLTSASVAPVGGLLLVSDRTAGDGALALSFRNESGKEIRSAAVTANLRVKTNVYALDATPVELRLSFAGAGNAPKDEEQQIRIPLPQHAYLFGVAQVSLDQVVFADGSIWTAQPAAATCSIGGQGSMLLTAK